MVNEAMMFDADILDLAVRYRHETHAEPELSCREFKTQHRLRTILEAAGAQDIFDAFGTGLVVDVHGSVSSTPGCTIGFRGDIDALPIQEQRPDLDYQSTIPGVMHACGHDTHSAIALAIALQLLRDRDSFSGTARFWFQPAEEAEPLGGRAFMNEGWLEGVDAAIGIHVNPDIQAGKIGVLPGVVNCSSDEWSMTIYGQSSHGGKPHEGVDAVVIAASIVGEIQTIVARTKDPNTPLVITVGTIHGGTATNIVADQVSLGGTIRAMDEGVRSHAHIALDRIAKAYSNIYETRVELEIELGEPPIRNDPAMCAVIRRATEVALGADALIQANRWTASDDFGFYTDAMPGVYYWYGCRNEELGNVAMLHHPKFGVADCDMVKAAKVGLNAMYLAFEEIAALKAHK